MQKSDSIDFAKLLGFQTITDELANELDFQNETLGDKLGAKVGLEPIGSPSNDQSLQLETRLERRLRPAPFSSPRVKQPAVHCGPQATSPRCTNDPARLSWTDCKATETRP